MEIWETDRLLLFIGFVIPGFVSLKTYDLLLPSAQQESGKRLVDAITYSCINYALLLWPIFLVERSQLRATHPLLCDAFYVFVVLVAPVLWAVLLRRVRLTSFVQALMPHPTARPWDYFFSRRLSYWVIVTLKDGKQVAGRYGSSSFASSAPASGQLYLEETWVLNDAGGFERPRVDSAGIMILSADIETIEFFNMTYGGERGGREETG
jgi:hypothetical protein